MKDSNLKTGRRGSPEEVGNGGGPEPAPLIKDITEPTDGHPASTPRSHGARKHTRAKSVAPRGASSRNGYSPTTGLAAHELLYSSPSVSYDTAALIKATAFLFKGENPNLITSAAGMYGEIKQKDIITILNEMEKYGLDEDSVFLDIGSGRGVPSIMAAYSGRIKAAIGIEQDYGAYAMSLRELHTVQIREAQLMDKWGFDPMVFSPRVRVSFTLEDATAYDHFDGVTHIYSFNAGMPGHVTNRLVRAFEASSTAWLFASYRKNLIETFRLANCDIVTQVKTSMTHSSEAHQCYFFVKRNWQQIREEARRIGFHKSINLLPQCLGTDCSVMGSSAPDGVLAGTGSSAPASGTVRLSPCLEPYNSPEDYCFKLNEWQEPSDIIEVVRLALCPLQAQKDWGAAKTVRWMTRGTRRKQLDPLQERRKEAWKHRDSILFALADTYERPSSAINLQLAAKQDLLTSSEQVSPVPTPSRSRQPREKTTPIRRRAQSLFPSTTSITNPLLHTDTTVIEAVDTELDFGSNHAITKNSSKKGPQHMISPFLPEDVDTPRLKTPLPTPLAPSRNRQPPECLMESHLTDNSTFLMNAKSPLRIRPCYESSSPTSQTVKSPTVSRKNLPRNADISKASCSSTTGATSTPAADSAKEASAVTVVQSRSNENCNVKSGVDTSRKGQGEQRR
eukprot:GHVQ01012402.1.p2 GENE.GHVQ01012402.1~~GHVQ01012402.1.p2  ORF type:complete len:677 (-),score=61.61 GHVQ01012402.1:2831-4861(-)